MAGDEREMTDKEKEIARLRAAEVFMQKETGDAVCGTCGYTYEMNKGARACPATTAASWPGGALAESSPCCRRRHDRPAQHAV